MRHVSIHVDPHGQMWTATVSSSFDSTQINVPGGPPPNGERMWRRDIIPFDVYFANRDWVVFYRLQPTAGVADPVPDMVATPVGIYRADEIEYLVNSHIQNEAVELTRRRTEIQMTQEAYIEVREQFQENFGPRPLSPTELTANEQRRPRGLPPISSSGPGGMTGSAGSRVELDPHAGHSGSADIADIAAAVDRAADEQMDGERAEGEYSLQNVDYMRLTLPNMVNGNMQDFFPLLDDLRYIGFTLGNAATLNEEDPAVMELSRRIDEDGYDEQLGGARGSRRVYWIAWRQNLVDELRGRPNLINWRRASGRSPGPRGEQAGQEGDSGDQQEGG